MARLIWTDDALDSLDAIGEYISRSSPGYAAPFMTRIIDIAESLAVFPMLGRIVPEFGREDVRELLFQNYRIVYRIKRVDGWLLVVLHGSADLTRRVQPEGS